MRQKSGPSKPPAETVVKDIRRRTRKQHSAEEKIRIVLEGLRGEDSIAELCRREGIATSLYYSWSKEFLEAGKKRLAGEPYRLVADLDAALVQQVIDVPERKREADVHHHRQADDLGAGLEPLERAFFGHAERLPSPLPRLKPGLSDTAKRPTHQSDLTHSNHEAGSTSGKTQLPSRMLSPG